MRFVIQSEAEAKRRQCFICSFWRKINVISFCCSLIVGWKRYYLLVSLFVAKASLKTSEVGQSWVCSSSVIGTSLVNLLTLKMAPWAQSRWAAGRWCGMAFASVHCAPCFWATRVRLRGFSPVMFWSTFLKNWQSSRLCSIVPTTTVGIAFANEIFSLLSQFWSLKKLW